MKKLFFTLTGLLILLGSFCVTQSVQAQSANLILNSSVESSTADLKSPLNWKTERWGTNKATFSYQTSGSQDGTKSLNINMTSFKNGDAKWYFDPISVTPNKVYIFSDYYKSSVQTKVVARIFDQTGKESYIQLGTVAKSTTWKNASFNFTAPTNASKVTILHLINKVGYLTTDNFYFGEKDIITPPAPPEPPTPPTPPTPPEPPLPPVPPVPPVTTNIIPNSSVEQNTNGATPLDWQTEKWGTNTAQFSYLSTGYTGSHSVKVQMTSYTDGDAKWAYNPQTAVPGDYLFTDYYQSNVTTQIAVRLIKNNGSEEYIGLGSADPSSGWKKYSDVFTIPIGVKQFTVLHFISSVGFLITDDYCVTAHTIVGFNRPLVTLTFDDGWEDNYTSVLPVINQYGFKSTQYLATTYLQSQTDQIYKIKAFATAGHEIGSHSITHPHLMTLTTGQIDNELSTSKTYLEGIIGSNTINSFATPYGEYDTRVITEIKKYYSSHRSTDEGYNSKDNFNPYNIRVQNMTNTTTLAEFNAWIEKAKQDKTWLVIVYHRIGASPTQYETTPANFNAQMAALSASGLTVLPINQALSEIKSQL